MLFDEVVAAVLKWRLKHNLNWGPFERRQVLPIGLHFYQPYPPADELAQSGYWEGSEPLCGVDLRLPEATELASGLGQRWASAAKTALTESGFDSRNGMFGLISATTTYAMVREFKPSRIVEVGGGWSTVVLSRAAQDVRAGGDACTVVTIDPFPSSALRFAETQGVELIAQRAEEVPDDVYGQLRDGDMLSIDSSHVIRYGGDVLHLYLEILPRLPRGVLVHVHDIFIPRRYPRELFDAQRYVWNEQYLLQALLVDSRSLDVLLPCWALHDAAPDAIKIAFGAEHSADRSSSFWMRKRSGEADAKAN